jgi:hypothetical protein
MHALRNIRSGCSSLGHCHVTTQDDCVRLLTHADAYIHRNVETREFAQAVKLQA